MDVKVPPIIADPIPFPCTIPEGFNGSDPDEPEFDESIHLNISSPKYLVGLDYKQYKFPLSVEDKKIFPGLAVSAPFRILSDEGVKVLRDIYTKHKFTPCKSRQPSLVRGLGYKSQFIRDFNNSPLLCKLFSHLSNEQLSAHTMPFNYSHINIGEIGDARPVDPWHIDSVDYVVVVIISDITDMIGGDLQVIMHPHETAFKLLKSNELKPSDFISASYKEAGCCMFMQGSKMVHHVTPVTKAREPRLSLVNSYVLRDVTKPDRTVFDTFYRGGDPPEIAFNEFARHKAWRSKAILDDVISKSNSNQEALAKLMLAAVELNQTVEILTGKKYDGIGFFDESKGDLVKYDNT